VRLQHAFCQQKSKIVSAQSFPVHNQLATQLTDCLAQRFNAILHVPQCSFCSNVAVVCAVVVGCCLLPHCCCSTLIVHAPCSRFLSMVLVHGSCPRLTDVNELDVCRDRTRLHPCVMINQNRAPVLQLNKITPLCHDRTRSRPCVMIKQDHAPELRLPLCYLSIDQSLPVSGNTVHWRICTSMPWRE
jgi:hypothetical protein